MKYKSDDIRKGIVLVITLSLFFILSAIPVCACTEIYVGADVSEDGTVIIARSNDWQQIMATHLCVTDRVDNVPGRTMPVNDAGDILASLPETTFHYISTPWMQNSTNRMKTGKDAAACANEYGVSMSMSVTAFSKDKALAADPLIENGLTEDTADDLVICQTKTAREAVNLLLDLIDTYGSNGVNIATIADQEEAWYIEIYTGHQYAAVKLPSDKVAAFGNEFCMEYLSDFDEAITSKELLTLPEENGFAKYGKNGELNLYETYSGNEMRQDYSHMRTWIGHQLLAPSIYGDYDKSQFYPLLFDPDKKVSLSDVFHIMRNRYEGTPYSPDETGRMRVIGTDTALSVHVLQIYPDLPAEMSVVIWESLAPDVYGVYVPLSNYCTGVSKPYGDEQLEDVGEDFDTLHYAWYALKGLNTIGLLDPKVYGTPVADYWREAENGMLSEMPVVLDTTAGLLKSDPDAAASYITDYCSYLQEQAFADAQSMLNTVTWYLNLNSNTLKLAKNPETNEYTGEERVLSPVPIDLSPEAYFKYRE